MAQVNFMIDVESNASNRIHRLIEFSQNCSAWGSSMIQSIIENRAAWTLHRVATWYPVVDEWTCHIGSSYIERLNR